MGPLSLAEGLDRTDVYGEGQAPAAPAARQSLQGVLMSRFAEVLTTARTSLARVSGRRVVAGTVAAAIAAGVLGSASTAWADGAAAAPVAAPATTSAASVGVQFHGMWQMYSDAQRIAVLDKLRAAGSRSVRLDVSWAMLQPTGPGSYDAWGTAFVDKVINMAYARGIKPLVILWLTPGWANRGQAERVLPDNAADYARVARWAAARWDGKVIGWEVWNEQNSPDFMEGADPVAYTRLLKTAYPAFKAGSAATPVVFGGVQYNDTDWIRRAYNAGAKDSFDVMATHPYMGVADTAPGTADDGTMWTLNHVRTVHDLMVARGDGAKKLWFTEFGWSTHATSPGAPNWERGVTETTQAAYLTQTVNLVRAQYPYVTRMYWYNERDLTDGGIQVEHYGLLHRDLSPKPALAALAAVNGTSTTAARSAGAGETPAPVAPAPAPGKSVPPLKTRPAPPLPTSPSHRGQA
jgi:hypothetical protein